ncbi:hypothetical protein L7F22_033144 [Adiantum nelumboides]|nr:hypothetical protein [Adiantum nelumboides]
MGKKGSWLAAVKKAFRSSSIKEPSQREAFVEKALRSSTKESSQNKPQKSTSKEDETKFVKDKRRWSFGKSARGDVASQQGKSDIRSEKRLIQVEQKQNKHALAIAAATAAAAEAAVAAAHAAAEVVRLTGNMQAGRPSSYDSTCSEDWAAVKIQTAFRGYLARRALRALRGLVRLQALVRGHTVRRQATLTMRCMQALVRVQARVRSRRVQMSEEGQAVQRQIWQRRQQEMLSPKTNPDGGQDMHEWNDSVWSMEKMEAKKLLKQEATLKRERALAYAFSHQLWRSSPGDCSPGLGIEITNSIDKPSWGWSWLERWMAARPWEARMLTMGTINGAMINTGENEIAIKSVGTDTGKPCTALNIKVTTPSSITSTQNANMELTPKKKPSTPKDPINGAIKGTTNATSIHSPMSSSTVTTQRPISVKIRPASPRGGAAQLLEEGASGMSTSKSVQSIYSAAGARFHFHNRRSSMAGSSVRDDDSLISSPSIPNYMAATQSARAKLDIRFYDNVTEEVSSSQDNQTHEVGDAEPKVFGLSATSFPSQQVGSLDHIPKPDMVPTQLIYTANSMETPVHLSETMQSPKPMPNAQEQVAKTPIFQAIPVQPATFQQPIVGPNGQVTFRLCNKFSHHLQYILGTLEVDQCFKAWLVMHLETSFTLQE